MAVTREPLSGASDYRPIQITGTTNVTANAIHTADASLEDSIYLWAVNRDTAKQTLTLQLGQQAAARQVPIDLEPNRPELVLEGQPLTNSQILDAFASLTNVISVWGYVNRVTD